MTIDCPHCEQSICISLSATKPTPGMQGRDLLNHLIKRSGKKLKVIAEEIDMLPNQLSNTRNGRVAIGHKNAILFADYFNHEPWEDFLTPRTRVTS